MKSATALIAGILAVLGGARGVEGQGTVTGQIVFLPHCQTPGQVVEADLSTGANVTPGQQDFRWQLASIPPNQSGSFPTYATIPYSSWAAATSPNQWIHRIQNFTPVSDSAGNYTYRLQFNIDPAIYSAIQIVGNYSADNSATIQLNGVTQTSCPGTVCFQSLHPINITSGFVSGLNNLDVIVNNNVGPTPTGLLVEATLLATCGCVAAPAGMVAWLTGDGNATDRSGHGNNGSLQGAAAYTAGEVLGSFAVNGAADFVEVPDHPSLNFGTGDFSIDAWIRTTNTTTATIVDKRTGTSSNPVGYTLFLFGGLLGFQLSDGLPFSNNLAPGPAINDGLWHHVAVTIHRASPTGGNLYVDGALVLTFDPTSHPGMVTNTANLQIGQRYLTSPQPFQGAIDELEIFDRELSAGDVQGLYGAGAAGKCKSACVVPPPGMVAWYPLDELTGATAVNDYAPAPGSLVNNVGTPLPGPIAPISPNAGPAPVVGMVGGALYFYGPRVEVPPQAELDFGTGDFSIDGWVSAVRCLPGILSPIADKLDTNSSTGYVFYLDQPTPGTAILNLRINGATFASAGTIVATANPLQNTGPWFHLAVTVARPSNGPAVGTFFINGAAAGTFTPPAGSVTNLVPMWIGKMRDPAGSCELAIDELEIFNRALAPSEVQSIFNAGTAGKCRTDSSDLGDAPDSVNHAGLAVDAYPNVPANFPTVHDPALPGWRGPLHTDAKGAVWLGRNVSFENEADMGPDQDGVNNLDPAGNAANFDDDDDAVNPSTLILPACGSTQFRFGVSAATAAPPGNYYVNVWFDFDRDGDWDDIGRCEIAPNVDGLWREWAVQNMVVNVPADVPPGGFSILTTPPFLAFNPTVGPMWMRMTLSEQPAVAADNGGSFTAPADLGRAGSVGTMFRNGYQFGETEDYLLTATSGRIGVTGVSATDLSPVPGRP